MNYTQTQEVNIAMNSNRDLFEKASVPRAVALMAIPTIVTMLVVVIYNMADTFFIGQTGDAMQVAAVSLATPVFMVFMALGNLFGIGGSSAISRALGEKNEQRARHISAFCCYGSLGVGILMTLIFILFMDGILKMIGASPATIDYARQYLTFVAIGAPFVMFGTAYGNIVRGEGAAKESMIGNLIGTITNIILDPIMILWLGWGVSGAAVATVLGNVAACIFYLHYLLHKKGTALSIKPSDFQWKNRIASSVFSIGIPASLILLQIGLCAGIQPLIGYNYGARNVKRLKKIFFFTGLCAVIMGTVLTLLMVIAREPIIHAFINDQEVVTSGIKMMIALFCSYVSIPCREWEKLCNLFCLRYAVRDLPSSQCSLS